MDKLLTGPQLLALRWLLPDWFKADRSVSAAVHSLRLYHKDLVEERAGTFGPRGGYCIQFRLTEAGVQEKTRRGMT